MKQDNKISLTKCRCLLDHYTKDVIAWNPLTNEVFGGQFDAPKDCQHWLLKFEGVGEDSELGLTEGYGRIEFAYSRMAV